MPYPLCPPKGKRENAASASVVGSPSLVTAHPSGNGDLLFPGVENLAEGYLAGCHVQKHGVGPAGKAECEGVGAEKGLPPAERNDTCIGVGGNHRHHFFVDRHVDVICEGAAMAAVLNAHETDTVRARRFNGKLGRLFCSHVTDTTVGVDQSHGGAYLLYRQVGIQIHAAFAHAIGVMLNPQDAVGVGTPQIGKNKDVRDHPGVFFSHAYFRKTTNDHRLQFILL